ncbi:hypothetical protein H4S07_004341, partial [Coemansia furcata]
MSNVSFEDVVAAVSQLLYAQGLQHGTAMLNIPDEAFDLMDHLECHPFIGLLLPHSCRAWVLHPYPPREGQVYTPPPLHESYRWAFNNDFASMDKDTCDLLQRFATILHPLDAFAADLPGYFQAGRIPPEVGCSLLDAISILLFDGFALSSSQQATQIALAMGVPASTITDEAVVNPVPMLDACDTLQALIACIKLEAAPKPAAALAAKQCKRGQQ